MSAIELPPGERPVAPHRRFSAFAKEFSENRPALISLFIVVLAVGAAIFAPLIAPQDPYNTVGLSFSDLRLPPGTVGSGGYVHIVGTDHMGRDLFSAILYGLRISLQIGILAGLIALLCGMTLGIAAAYRGGLVEAAIMRIVDLQLSFPAVLLALVVAAVLGQGRWQVTTALIAAQFAYFARTAHGAAKVEREKEYVEAALSTPLKSLAVVIRHIVPNTLPPLIVVASVQIANSISLEATLSFLGVGLPVTEPSLGMLISNGFQYMLSGRYWISLYPGLALITLLLAINIVGDQLRDQLNPRLKR